MSITVPIPKREPQVIAAGDTLQWERQLNDFSATTWTMHYVIRSPKNIYKFDATNDAGNFLVNVSSAVTATWEPGQYAIGAYITNASAEQIQVRTAFPTLTITGNLAVNPQGVNTVPWAVTMLSQIENTISQLTTRTVDSASVNGNMYTLANISELFKLRERFKSEVRRLEDQARLNAGLGASNRIGVRFRGTAQQSWPTGWWVPWQ